jgi:LemA protein
MQGSTIFLLGIIGTLGYGVILYNNLVSLKEQVKNAKTEIGIQLDRRGKIFDNLIETVKQYMKHENDIFTKITALRSHNSSTDINKNDEDKLSEIIQSGQLQSSINMVAENYPDLKSNTNMLHFQEEIVSTENKLSFAKKAFNSSIEEFNSVSKSFPANIIYGMFSSLQMNEEYWDISEEKKEELEEKRVSFN